MEPGSSAKPGEVYEWTSAAGAPYRYRVADKVSRSNPPNLLLMLHGTGVKWGWPFWNYPIAQGRFRPDDIVVAPEGLTPGNGDTFNFVQGKKDGDHIAGIIRTFRKAFPIGRVYLYGHSQGAFFTYWFAGEHPDLVDGIVAHAGNVLQVKHTPASKSGVAIGILHGEADAVVPVECAYRTEKVYREEGYDNVKLYVVEGLTAQSGHWPLPVQVGEMLTWLDEVTEVSAPKAIERAVAEIRAEAPDLAGIVAGLERARELAKRAKLEDEEKAKFEANLELVDVFVAECRDAHAAALVEVEELGSRKPEYGPWAARFRTLHAVFAEDKEWGKVLRGPAGTAKKHSKTCDRALRGLGSMSKRTVKQVASAVESAFLAPEYERLAQAAARIAADPPEGVDAKEVAELGAALEARKAQDAEGIAAARALTKECAAAFVSARPEFAEAGGDGDK